MNPTGTLADLLREEEIRAPLYHDDNHSDSAGDGSADMFDDTCNNVGANTNTNTNTDTDTCNNAGANVTRVNRKRHKALLVKYDVWTDSDVRVMSDIGSLSTLETKWVRLKSSNGMNEGNMFMIRGNERVRLVVLKKSKKSSLLKLISVTPNEQESVILDTRSVLINVNEPIPKKMPHIIVPVSHHHKQPAARGC
jgi:protein-tyrosine phosphatase